MDFNNDFNNNSEEYVSDDYNPIDYSKDEEVKENKFIKGIIDSSLDKKGFKFNKSVDVRIILTNLDYIGAISETINNFDLSNFNVVISSLIPTSDFEIAKNTTHGADLLLIATEFNEEGKKLFYQFKKYLKTDYNYIEYLKLPNSSSISAKYNNSSNSSYNNYKEHNYANYKDEEDLTEFFEDEIANSIIRAGLSCVSNLSIINKSKLKFFQIKENFDKTSQKLEKTHLENNHLDEEVRSLREKNEELNDEILSLQKELDKLKSDYSTYKSRFDNIYSKDSLEIFELSSLWRELFDEYFTEDINNTINIATDNFKPTDVIVGQGFIGAKNKEDAMDWLKIIKTALIVNLKDFKSSNNKNNYNNTSNYSNSNKNSEDIYPEHNYQNSKSNYQSSKHNYQSKYDDDLDNVLDDSDDDNSVSNFSSLW